MSAKYKSPSFLLPNEINTNTNPLNTDGNPATGTGINSLYSMDFDSASSDYIDAGNITELNNLSAISTSIWLKTSNVSTAPIILNGGSSITNRFYLQLLTNGTTIRYVIGSSVENITVSNIADGNWHHISTVQNGTSLDIYLDGAIQNTSTITVVSPSTNIGDNFKIGRYFLSAANYFDGQIDEVAIFNRALNTTEISALYDGTGSNIRPSNLMASNLNPIAYYPLGEQAQMQGYLGNEASSEWQFPNGVLQDYVIDFDGTDNVNSEANISSASSFTASIWINRDDSATQYIYGQWVDGTTASQSWVIQTVGGIVYFNVRDASLSVKSAISTTSLTTGVWYNIIAVWTGSNVKLYINNSLEDTTACSSMNNPSTAVKLAIGSSSNNVSPFNGKISNAVIWNSDQESNRDNIYNNGSPQTTYTVTPQNWWKLNADSVYTPSAPNYTTALKLNVSSSDNINFTQGLLNNLSEFSISFWYNRAAANSWPSYSVILTQSGLLDIGQFRYENNNAGIYVGLTTANGTFTIPSTGSGRVYLNEWLFVTVVYDGVNLISYRNGELAPGTNTVAATGNTVTNTNNFKLEPTHGLDYSVSNLAFYNSALTSSQVSTLFNFGTPETAISFSPQAWWKLDDQTAITDSSGNGNTGTNNGATDATTSVAVVPSWKIPSALPITSTPNYTTALDFVANGDTISIPDSNDLDLSGTDFSISFWVNANSISSSQMILQKYSGSAGWAIYNQAGSKNTLDFYQSGAFFGLDPNNDIENNVWSHYVVTANVSASEYKVYKNGYLINTISRTVNITSSTQPLYIGSLGGTGFYYNGLLSNIAIFNTALTSTQVSTLYNNGTPETAISFSPVSWWKLDTGGSTITDYGSGGNNGTNNGASPVTSDVLALQPVNGVSTTLPSTALQQSDLQFDSPYSNYSLSFDGATYIDCTDNDMFSFGNGTTDSPFSVSFWTKLNSVTGTQPFLSKDTTSPNREWAISIFSDSSNGVRIFLKDQGGNNQQSIDSSTALTTGVWYHITTTYDGRGGSDAADGLSIYINGSLDTPTNIAKATYTAMSNTTAPVYIGKYSTSEINGKIDETAIFNTELTSAQVLEIYNNGRPKDLTTFSGTAPISWWRLGENAYFNDVPAFTVPNSITGAPNGTGSGSITTMISADAPGTYANGIGTNLDILDRVGDAPLSTSNSQSYNMIPSDISPYVPKYVGNQISNTYSMSFNGTDEYIYKRKVVSSSYSALTGIFKCTWIKMSDKLQLIKL